MGNAMDELKRVPAWGWIIVGLVAVGILLALRNGSKKKSAIGAAAQPQPQDLSALTSTDTTQGNAALQELMAIEQDLSKIGQGNPSSVGINGGSRTVRSAGANPYYGIQPDASNILSQESQPGWPGAMIHFGHDLTSALSGATGYVPFGSSLNLNPSPIVGPNNRGTNLYYQGTDQNGQTFFISAYDLVTGANPPMGYSMPVASPPRLPI